MFVTDEGPPVTQRTSTTTGFFRNLPQLKLLRGLQPKPERIDVFACSRGPEAYSLSMIYSDVRGLKIRAFDIDQSELQIARAAVYGVAEAAYYGEIPEVGRKWLVERNGTYTVDPGIARRCTFEFGDILSPPRSAEGVPADIVTCQNVLVHLPPGRQQVAIEKMAGLVRPGGLLLLGGTDLDALEQAQRRLGLRPVTDACEQIHEAWSDRRRVWDDPPVSGRPYYALEPYGHRPGSAARYSSIFRRPEGAEPQPH